MLRQGMVALSSATHWNIGGTAPVFPSARISTSAWPSRPMRSAGFGTPPQHKDSTP